MEAYYGKSDSRVGVSRNQDTAKRKVGDDSVKFEDKGKSGEMSEVDQKLVLDLRLFAGAESTLPAHLAKENLEHVFKGQPIPPKLIDEAIRIFSPIGAALKIYLLARARGPEILPWVQRFISSSDEVAAAVATIALFFIDPNRGLNETRTLIRKFGEAPSDTRRNKLEWCRELLIDVDSAESRHLADEIEKLL